MHLLVRDGAPAILKTVVWVHEGVCTLHHTSEHVDRDLGVEVNDVALEVAHVDP
jgi:hypothetical protein